MNVYCKMENLQKNDIDRLKKDNCPLDGKNTYLICLHFINFPLSFLFNLHFVANCFFLLRRL